MCNEGPVRPGIPNGWGQLGFFVEQNDLGQTAWERVWTLLADEIAARRQWQPAPHAIFRALELTPRQRVRVVIIGQDPYHHRDHADGLAFSQSHAQKPRHSLKKILAKLEQDTGTQWLSCDLAPWARAGVLLLNSALTVQISKPRSHREIWQEANLTREVLTALSEDGGKVIFAFGEDAQRLCREAGIDQAKNVLIRTSHPMARRNATRYFGEAKPFREAKAGLEGLGLEPFSWDRIH